MLSGCWQVGIREEGERREGGKGVRRGLVYPLESRLMKGWMFWASWMHLFGQSREW